MHAFGAAWAVWAALALAASQGAPAAAAKLTDATLRQAVGAWIANATGAHAMYGEINTWDTSEVKTMNRLFYRKGTFNNNIDSWQTDSVKTFDGMFNSAQVFDQPLNSWQTGSVATMASMFNGAIAFNKDINAWQTSSVTTTASMFASSKGKARFNQPLNSVADQLYQDHDQHVQGENEGLPLRALFQPEHQFVADRVGHGHVVHVLAGI